MRNSKSVTANSDYVYLYLLMYTFTYVHVYFCTYVYVLFLRYIRYYVLVPMKSVPQIQKPLLNKQIDESISQKLFF